jgi:RHH-type proline utilization regulon transcriptional repressor/proline dehydrogenase/delta 1-pyrroline-5-carboxylate dehydrogenase
VLHVAASPPDELEQVIADINATGYGLTLGLHSRIDATRRLVESRARAGNFYVNRNQIGAVVGSQPFGGEGLSGTGPRPAVPTTSCASPPSG